MFILLICMREAMTKKLQGQFKDSLFPRKPRNMCKHERMQQCRIMYTSKNQPCSNPLGIKG